MALKEMGNINEKMDYDSLWKRGIFRQEDIIFINYHIIKPNIIKNDNKRYMLINLYSVFVAKKWEETDKNTKETEVFYSFKSPDTKYWINNPELKISRFFQTEWGGVKIENGNVKYDTLDPNIHFNNSKDSNISIMNVVYDKDIDKK
ncbi:hypothetical protein [Mesomycoplasma lagogenitalium]|uniref:Uncharacterized protein n=1 Tax=Mesomycoplasma lagogenitalium TaxID=171286 RepID=A0ABY8LWU0_9BACT|nr:hypothetical protein [Mesomycoplasma lagogenitalium]WGI36783.1 hypothetical protein QEG99_00635 [Mesomycoplasma lagogenitalium]